MAGIGAIRMSSDDKEKDHSSVDRCCETLTSRRRLIAGTAAAASTSGANNASTEAVTVADDRPPGQRKRARDDEEIVSEMAREAASRSGAPPVASSSGGGSRRPAVFGYVSVAGRLREMEDCVCVKPQLFRLPNGSYVHFFAVFDGHGGSHISELCKSNLHLILSEELAAMMPGDHDHASTSSPDQEDDTKLRKALTNSFARMDAIAMTTCACGRVGLPVCTCELAGRLSPIVGSTAVVGLVTDDKVLVANCGDSRAVLGRGGHAYALSCDHKPDRPDELARIEAAGGRVIYNNGARVSGILAMSRALGDRFLKPEVISEPDIKTITRTDQDEFLIFASDGLWDVLSNEMACNVVRQSLDEIDPATNPADSLIAPIGLATADPEPSEPPSTSTSLPEEEERQPGQDDEEGEERVEPRCRMASAILTRLALGRGSGDNISVIVVDLKRS